MSPLRAQCVATTLAALLTSALVGCADEEPTEPAADATTDAVSDASDASDPDVADASDPDVEAGSDTAEPDAATDADGGADDVAAPDTSPDDVGAEDTADDVSDADDDAAVDTGATDVGDDTATSDTGATDSGDDTTADADPGDTGTSDAGELPTTCPELIAAIEAELDAVRGCTQPEQCGQVMTGTSCGCTRNLVARTDADLARFEALREAIFANSCDWGLGSTCDCPEADGYACVDGFCTWNYL